MACSSAYVLKGRYRWLAIVVVGTFGSLLSCENDGGDVILPPVNGGDGRVIPIPTDGGARDAAMGGSTGRAGGSGGRQTAGGGGSPGTGGTGTAGTGAAGTAGTGGSGGVGGTVVDDPCTACEKAKCSNPVNGSPLTLAAYEVCFLGTGVSPAALGPVCPTDPTSTALAATNGPMAGTAKTTLCQSLLKCVHQTNCTGGIDVDNQTQCYCGTDASGGPISLGTCVAPTFTPTGMCEPQVAAALEVSQFAVSYTGFSDPCFANGAAFAMYDFCDANCCEAECGMTVSGGEDPTYCNAPGSGGSRGTGGSTGSGGSKGTGGVTGVGGSGSSTGGATGLGGTTTSTGGAGAAGSMGGSTGGSIGGSTGGSIGGAGGSGASRPIQNGQFDTNTDGWVASYGATISRSPTDAANNAQSGSLDVVLGAADPTLSVEVGASQCISVSAGATYHLSVEIFVPTGSSSSGALGLWFFNSTDCSGSIASSVSTPASATNAWQLVTGTAQAPSSARSASVRAEVIKPIGQTSGEALFDAVMVSPQ
jgi:hypothetical protein